MTEAAYRTSVAEGEAMSVEQVADLTSGVPRAGHGAAGTEAPASDDVAREHVRASARPSPI